MTAAPPPSPPPPPPPPRPRAAPSSGCCGDSCPHPDSWPLHHVRLRGSFLRLCTSCVLRHHPGSFCPSCLDLLDPATTPTTNLVHCSRCPSVSHTSCLPPSSSSSSSSPPNSFLCPFCSNPSPSFSLFPKRPGSAGPTPLDPRSAKVLLAAARVALSSMRKAAAASRAEADRKVRESVLARRRARDALERAALLARRDRERAGGGGAVVSVSSPIANAAAGDAKRKAEGPTGADAKRRVQGREREKLLKLHDSMAVGRGKEESGGKGVGVGAPPNAAAATTAPRSGNQGQNLAVADGEPRMKSVCPPPAAMLPGQY